MRAFAAVETGSPSIPRQVGLPIWRPKWYEYPLFFLGGLILASTTIGAIFGFVLLFKDMNRTNRHEAGLLWLLCTWIGKWAMILGIILFALLMLLWWIAGAPSN